jgi:redox-sensitive bicupin YhaK (pirin superfamily)
MIDIRRSADRGFADHGWLRSRHTFSFAGYFDPAHIGFGPLRVINEDRVAPRAGFGAHGHRDMEIISYVLEGELRHEDSMGNGSVIRPGDVQRMSAGTGVTHSEINPGEAPVHFLQIWLHPSQHGLVPEYEQKFFPTSEKRGRLRLVVSPDGAAGSLRMHQDARLFAGLFDGTETATLAIEPRRNAYVHVARGHLRANGVELGDGDALKLTDVSQLALESGVGAEVLVFDLPPDSH